MTDLYERLLARIDRGDPHRLLTAWKVVRDVVELHAPLHTEFGTLCRECSALNRNFPVFVADPCNTKRAIASALGVEAP